MAHAIATDRHWCGNHISLIGTIMGVMGYFGGRVDIVTFLITVRLSMPVVLVALAVVAIVGGSLQVAITVLGLLLWDRFAVVMRSSTLQVRSMVMLPQRKRRMFGITRFDD